MKISFTTELWLYQGEGAWVFATLPKGVAEDIKQLTGDLPRRGFGSVRVSVEVAGVRWKTSIFPDSKSNSYLLPIKKEVRDTAEISVGDVCDFVININDID